MSNWIVSIIEGFVKVLVALIEKIDPSKKNKNLPELSQNLTKDAVLKEFLLPKFLKPSGDSFIDDEIEEIYKQLLGSFRDSDYSSVYFRKFDVSIDVAVYEDHIKVKSEYTINFVNPYHIDYTYKRRPALRDGLEFDSYKWISVTYQGQSCMKKIQEYDDRERQTPYENYRFKSGIELPLIKDLTDSTLHFSSEYESEGDGFFYSYRFWNYCKGFNIDVRLTGPEVDKYELQWDLFFSNNRRNNQIVRGIMACDPRHVKLSDYGWVFPGDGYVVSIARRV